MHQTKEGGEGREERGKGREERGEGREERGERGGEGGEGGEESLTILCSGPTYHAMYSNPTSMHPPSHRSLDSPAASI